MFFSQDWRERIKAENPEAGFGMRASFSGDPLRPLCADHKKYLFEPRVGEIGKLLGAKWKDMDDEEKKV